MMPWEKKKTSPGKEKCMIRLILSDLDGTLLPRDGVLPEDTFHLLRELKKKGIRFAAASGRQYENLRRLFAPVCEEIDFVCENGALTVAQGKVIDQSLFPPAVAAEVMKDILSSGLQLLVSLPKYSVLYRGGDRFFHEDVIYRLKNAAIVTDNPEDFAGECIKISGFCADGILSAAGPLQEKWGGQMHADVAGRCWLDFTLRGKGDGLKALAAFYGLELSETAAFGDQQNDLSMLRIAGKGYLMESGNTALLENGMSLCRSVTDTIRALAGL